MQGLLPAIVFSTEDPLNLGRIQVECPLIAPGEILPHEEDNWIPVLESFVVTGKAGGSHSLLQKGNQVMLAPRFGSSQQAPSWVVVGAVHSTVDKLHPLLDRTKGTHGSVSPAGKIEINNDKEGSQIVSYPNGATQQISKEGNITSQTKGGARSHLGQDGELRIENEKSFTTHDPSGQVASGNAGGASSVLSSSGNVDVTASSGTALSLQSSGTLSGSGGSTGQALSKLEKASTKLQEAIKSSEVASKELSSASSNLPGSSPNSSKDFPKIFQTIGESLEKIGNESAESLGVPNLQEIANFLRYKLNILKPQISILLDTDRALPEFPTQLSGLFATQELTPEPATLDAIARTLTNLRYNRKLQINFLLSKLLGNDYAPETGILEQLELESVMAQIAAIDPINPDAIATLQGFLPKKLQGIEHEILMRAIALPPAERIAALIGATRIQDAKAIHSQISKAFPNFSKQSFSNSSKDFPNNSNDSKDAGNSLETPPEEVVTQSAKEAQQKIQSFLSGIPKGSSAAKVVAGSSSSQLLAAGGASKVAAEPGTAYLKSPAGKVEAGGGGATMSGGGGSVGASAGGVAMSGKQGEKVEISNNKLSMGGGGEGAIAIDKDDVILTGQGGATISLANGKIEAIANEISLLPNVGSKIVLKESGAVVLQDSAQGKIEIDQSKIVLQGEGDRVSVAESIEIGQGGGAVSIAGTDINLSGKVAIASSSFDLVNGTEFTVKVDATAAKFSYLTSSWTLAKDIFATSNKAGTSTIEGLTVQFLGGTDGAHKLEVKTEGIYADGVEINQASQALQARATASESKIQTLESKIDWGKLEAQGIAQFFLEAQGDGRNPATRLISTRNLFLSASPYPGRLGAISVSPNGSNAIANGQRLSFSNQLFTERRTISNQLAALSGGFIRFTYTIATNSPTGTKFNADFSLYKIYLADGSEVSATGTFAIASGVLIWTANGGSPVVQNTRGWTVLAIDYPIASGISPGLSSFDAAWISNTAIAPANLRSLSEDLIVYENPANNESFILIYNRATGAINTIYKKLTILSDALGIIKLPVGVAGLIAFVEGTGNTRYDLPVIINVGANTNYNCLIYHAPTSAEFWQFQITERQYQGTQDLAFLDGATIATMPKLYAHTQGGGVIIPPDCASLTNSAIANWLSELSLPTDTPPDYARYFLNGTIKETGESPSTLSTTFKQLNLLPSTTLAFPALGEAIATAAIVPDTTHVKSISAKLVNSSAKTFGFKAPLVTATYFQFALIFVAIKAGVAKLVIATHIRAGEDVDNLADLPLDSSLGVAIDTFPLQSLPTS